MKVPVDENRIRRRILEIKEELKDSLRILTHNYQRKEIVELGDFRGDSFDLSQKAARDKNARFIVFCGVHFMAESAEILARPYQTVQIPDLEAGCWMADMADTVLVQRAWDVISAIVPEGSMMPIAYMNSDAALKAFCGRRGGVVCTSSNAVDAFRWGLSERDRIFFFPDQHLGRNSGFQMGIPPDEMVVWNPHQPMGGTTPDRIRNARIILWDGYCLVHTRFDVAHIRAVRKRYPQARIVVHPECTRPVVAEADAVGSTGFIVDTVAKAPAGSILVIGTETHLIQRLALENPDKKVLELHRSLCPNMFKINLANLLETLEDIGKRNRVTVPDEIKKDARKALDQMLRLSPKPPGVRPAATAVRKDPVLV